MKLEITELNHLREVARKILAVAREQRIFLFYGEMGAGKTTLIKALCQELGVRDTASSPTFSIVNEYASPGGPVFHFDFYRLKNQTEALDMGYEDYLYSGNYCFIEWPEKIPDLLPEKVCRIYMEVKNKSSRLLQIECPEK